MGLDYTSGCVNFRDLGGYINLLLNKKTLQEGKIYRGGSIDYINKLESIENPKTIINLRNGIDAQYFECNYIHFPMSNRIEKYDTSQREVQLWLNQIIKTFEDPNLEYPILIHCLSGKDRTGIVAAAILRILGIDPEIIIEEYLLSDGEVERSRIALALKGFECLENYFNRVDLVKVKKNLISQLVIKKD